MSVVNVKKAIILLYLGTAELVAAHDGIRRDGHRCQYCGRPDLSLTVDHIVPVSRGGEDTWENLVCACVACNNKKGDRTPDGARMPLRRKPMRPNHVTFIRHFVGTLDERWKPYLFLN